MQTMRYINLLNSVSKIHTRKCFVYNNVIIFAVPAKLLSKAIGSEGKNVRTLKERLGKRIRIIKDVRGIEEAERFVKDIVSPVDFVSLEVKDGLFILTAGPRNKAALIGRNKRRLIELNKILEDNFGKELKIV